MPHTEEELIKELEKFRAEHKRISDELREARHELEIRVKVRTAEVTKANEDLQRDIAARKRIESELLQTKERFEYILGATKTNVDVIDSAFNLRYVDPTWQKIYGDPAGRKCYEYFMGRSDACPTCGIPIALETRKITVTKEVLPRENNRVIEVHTIPFQDQGGEWLVAEFNIDITERTQTEEALKQNESFLSNIFSSIQDGISILDKEMNIVRVNTIMEEWYAHAMPLVGKKCYEAYHCRSGPCTVCPTIRTLKSGEAAYDIVPKTGPAGKVVGWLDLYSFPMFDQKTGAMEGVIEYVRDITKRRGAEEALRESEDKYRSIVENTTDVIMLTCPDGIIAYLSPACQAVLGYSPEELVGKQPWIVYPEDLRKVKNAHYQALKGGNGINLDYRIITKSGRIKWIAHSWAPILKDNKLQMVVSVIRDITERKEAREKLEKLNKEILLSNKRLKQLSLRDSHTGLYNHRYLEEIIEVEFDKAKRYGSPLSIIMLDIDYFKSINDAYGHQFGDLVLSQLAGQLKRKLRRYDIVIRYGGEEFIILSPITDRPTAMVLAQRLLDSLHLYNFGNRKQKVRLKLSFAVAAYPESRVAKGMDLIEEADKILNYAKESGGNRVYSSLDMKKERVAHLAKNGREPVGVKYLREKIDKLNRRANQSLIEAIFAFAKTIELKDKYTGRHVELTVKYATDMAKKLRLSSKEIDDIRQASILHDLGKIGISEKILLKRAKLTKEEFEEIKRHPQIGVDIIRPLHFLHDIIPLILYHHERWDGNGYPHGLKGEDIPIGARIIAVADAYQALTSHRPYRKAYAKRRALQIIREDTGTHFDPNVVKVFLEILGK